MQSDFVRLVFRACASPAWPARPTTEVLSVPYSLTQTGVLSPSGLAAEARLRGFHVTIDQLSALHELGLLSPLFELIEEPDPGLNPHETSGNCEWPFEQHVAERRLTDPRPSVGLATSVDRFRYSVWQLLWFYAAGWELLLPNSPEGMRAASRTDSPTLRMVKELSTR